AAPGGGTAPGDKTAAEQKSTVDQNQEQNTANALAAEKRQGEPGATKPQPDKEKGTRSKRALAKYASNKRRQLAEQIRSGNFEHFRFLLGVALVKDVLDYVELFYGDPGFTGSIINIFCSITITAVLYNQPSTFRKRFIKKYVSRILLAIIVEYIPVANEFIPAYTIEMLVIFFDNLAQQKRGLAALNKLDALQKRFKSRGGHHATPSKKDIDESSQTDAA
ncbi:MAG: hypothetical protein ACD_41C00049G0001, partial [uncultured bacterium]